MLDNVSSQEINTASEQFGLTDEDVKNYKIKSFFGKIGYYFAKIEPTLVKILNSIIYYSIKFIKAVSRDVFRMVFKGGGE